jgi:hypothetical protein
MSDAATSLRRLVDQGSLAYQNGFGGTHGRDLLGRYSARLDQFRTQVNLSREMPNDAKRNLGQRIAAAKAGLEGALSDRKITPAERQQLVAEAGRIGGRIDAIVRAQASSAPVPADTYRRIAR